MPSDSLIAFHKRMFPDGDVPLYSKETFYALVDEVSRLEENNLSKKVLYEQQKQKQANGREP